ncbi:MAG TPA: hypothetical protein VGN41_23400 [Streptosporangiaceae bacterium]|jgi:hypothetical protein
MAKRDVDPVFHQLVRSINEADQALVPVLLTAHGTVLRGSLISEARYFTELAEMAPMLSALQPGSGLLGKDYAKEVEGESGHYVHLRAGRLGQAGDDTEGLWRLDIGAVDAWSLPAAAVDSADDGDRGPFARLLGSGGT